MKRIKKSFASDNNSGVHPAILKALEKANEGHVIAYGDDPFTHSALLEFKKQFGPDTDTYFVFTGTAANVLGISAVTKSYNAIICAETAHLNEHECGGPENYIGCKVITLPSKDGKISLDLVKTYMEGQGNEHYAQIKVIAITQPTELGAVYSGDEILALASYAHTNDLFLVMDGARIANAAAYLGKSFKQITGDLGVDVLSFGGTKNGMMCGEAIVFFNHELSCNFKYIRKQGMQLGAKMRFLAAQFSAYFENDLWLKNARHANEMAQYLADRIKDIPEITIPHSVVTNAIFPILPPQAISRIKEEFFFYMWDELKNQVRWMTSFDTEKADVDEFVSVVEKACYPAS